MAETTRTDFNLEAEYGSFLKHLIRYANDNPEEFIAHYGVKGMKWGVLKSEGSKAELSGLGPDTVTAKTKYGDEITMTKNPPTPIHKGLAKISTKYREAYERGASVTIRDKDGKKVGDAQLEKRSDDELYLNWLGIDKSQRGKGYASAVMKAGEEFGRELGVKKMTLEVPGNSPDARHIYEKLGFKVIKEDIDPTDIMWGGLTSMEYRFDEARQSDVPPLTTEDVLAHYGVKGMRWGRRKDRGGSSGSPRDTVAKKKVTPSEDHEVATQLRKKSVSEMSNVELKRLNERLQLETQYAQLTQKQSQTGQGEGARAKMAKGQKVIKNTLAVADTANRVITTINSPAAKEIRKLLNA